MTRTVISLLLLTVSLTAADFSKVEELRRSGDYPQASSLLKNYSSPARYNSLPATERMEFLQGVLELAHVKALQNDVPGALALLNWAENLPEPYPRAYSCVKYAEILLDIGEPERARGYLKSFEEVRTANARSNDSGNAVGQGGRSADLGAAWRELAEQAELLKAQAEFVELKEKFGATYANYVKLRRLQKQASKSKPDYESAMKLADEIIKSAPDSQFAGAAGYLKGELMASFLSEKSSPKEIKEVKDHLEKFVKKQPDGLYRGEVLMLLGKISLEIEWNAKEAEKHYTAALAHFREARAKRDAVSLYAPLSEKLKQQVTPKQKLTSLNEWKRIVYSSEDPLKLYNTAVAPPWYVDEREKECHLALGLLSFSRGDFSVAKEHWSNIKKLDSDIAAMDTRLPNVSTRLLASCEKGCFLFTVEEKKVINDPDTRLKLTYAEYLFLNERFDSAHMMFDRIYASSNDNRIKAAAKLGCAYTVDTRGGSGFKDEALSCFDWVLKKNELKDTPLYTNAYIGKISCLMGIGGAHGKALAMLEDYFKDQRMQKNGRRDYYDRSVWNLCMCLLIDGKYDMARQRFDTYMAGRDENSVYARSMKSYFEKIKKYGSPWPQYK